MLPGLRLARIDPGNYRIQTVKFVPEGLTLEIGYASLA